MSTECPLPPPGWKCTRSAGHEGPCAAVAATPETDAAIVEIVDEEATRKAGSNVTAVRKRWVRPDFARRLERERDAARQQRDALASTLETYRLRSRCHSPEIDEQAVKLLAEHKARMGGKKS